MFFQVIHCKVVLSGPPFLVAANAATIFYINNFTWLKKNLNFHIFWVFLLLINTNVKWQGCSFKKETETKKKKYFKGSRFLNFYLLFWSKYSQFCSKNRQPKKYFKSSSGLVKIINLRENYLFEEMNFIFEILFKRIIKDQESCK